MRERVLRVSPLRKWCRALRYVIMQITKLLFGRAASPHKEDLTDAHVASRFPPCVSTIKLMGYQHVVAFDLRLGEAPALEVDGTRLYDEVPKACVTLSQTRNLKAARPRTLRGRGGGGGE